MCSAFILPKGLSDSCPGYIAFMLFADCIEFAVDRRGDRNFVLHTCHTTVPWHGESTTSTLSHSYRRPPQHVGVCVLLGKPSKEWVEKDSSRGALCWCGLLQAYIPMAITNHTMSHCEETNSSARWRVRGMRMGVRSGLSLPATITWRSRVSICRDPPPPIPMDITVWHSSATNMVL